MERMPVEDFIRQFRTKFGRYDLSQTDTVRSLFKDGFCYYFAKILSEAYPGGKIFCPWPLGHLVYSYCGKYYDIEGEFLINEHEFECFIPFKMPFFIIDEYFEFIKFEYMHTFAHDEDSNERLRFLLESKSEPDETITLTLEEMVVAVYLGFVCNDRHNANMNEYLVSRDYDIVKYYINIERSRFEEIHNFVRNFIRY